MASDAINGENIEDSLKNRSTEAFNTLSNKMRNKTKCKKRNLGSIKKKKTKKRRILDIFD
jgi:hypothetical protein